MFSLEPSNEQNRMLTPRRPAPPHVLLGTIVNSRTDWSLLLYTSRGTGLSMFCPHTTFKWSLSSAWKRERKGQPARQRGDS